MISKSLLRMQSWKVGDDGDEQTDSSWSCVNGEIEVLQEFLNGQFPKSGLYQLASKESQVQEAALHLDAGRVDQALLRRIVTVVSASPEVAEALADLDDAGLLSTLIERNRQRAGLKRWKAVVENPGSTEPDIQAVLDKEWWIFGGRYIDKMVRRNLVVGEQLDLALVRPDGALHIVVSALTKFPMGTTSVPQGVGPRDHAGSPSSG